MLRLVFTRGLVALALPLAALALAFPALADETTDQNALFPEALLPDASLFPEALFSQGLPMRAQGGPPASPGNAPEDGPTPGPPAHAPAHGTSKPAPAPQADGPGNSENTPAANARASASVQEPQEESATDAPPPGRVKRRSVGVPDFSDPTREAAAPAPTTDDPGPRESRERLAGRVRADGDGREGSRDLGRVEPLRNRATQRATGSRGPAVSRAADSTADPAAPSSSGPAGSGPPEAAEPDQPLPARIVPRPLRRIVEVVPTEIWAALGALALLALALAVSSWLTARRAARLRRQREALLEEVGLLQAALLPPVPDHLPASVAYRPTDGPAAGGDFYEAFGLSDGRTAIILGDVSGHGREALSRTTLIRYTLRAYLEAGLEPREVVKVGADALDAHFGTGFATVTVAVHDPGTGRFTYASAGHAPPIVVGPAAFDPVTACSAPPIGIGESTGFRQSTFTLTEGSTACLYTDGVTEARRGGRMLGRGQVEQVLADLPVDAGAEELLDRIAADADELTDDMAICLVRAPAGAPAVGPRIEELEVDEHDVGDSLERFLRACGVPLAEVPGILREAGEAARREGSATVRVRLNDFRPGVDVVPGNVVRLEERRRAVRL